MSEKERPVSRRVDLTDGTTVTVGKIRFGHYRKLRTAMAGNLLSDVMEKAGNEDAEAAGTEFFAKIVEAALQVIDENVETLIRGCLNAEDNKRIPAIDDMDVVDVLNIRNACGEVNDLRAVLALEGNVFAAAWEWIAPLIREHLPTLLKSGGLPSSHNSPEPTDGDALT